MDKNEALEIKISYLENYVSEINNVIMEHENKIEKLIVANKYLKDKLLYLEEGIKENIDNTPPPHY